MEKSYLKLKKRFKALCLVLFVFVLIFGFVIYNCYDYLVFKTLIARGYIYTDSLNKLYLNELGEDNFNPDSNSYGKDFDKAVISVFTKRLSAIKEDRYTYLYTPKQYIYTKEYEKKDALLSGIDELSDNTVLVNFPNFSKGTKDFLLTNKKSLAPYENIIIDLRHNYGGLLADCYTMADLFLEKGDVIGYEVTRVGFYPAEKKAKTKPYFSFKNIIILQDENTASAAETFILALKGNLDNVTTIGAKTYGKGIGQVTIPLTAGYAVKATVLLVNGPNGSSIHNNGIEPDILYDKDDIVDYAFNTIEN